MLHLDSVSQSLVYSPPASGVCKASGRHALRQTYLLNRDMDREVPSVIKIP